MPRLFLFVLLTAGLLAGQSAPPNVVLIVADDLGWADLGVYGADLHETPNIDALAGESALFTNAYSASPVCSPTRASILTGKHPARLRITIWLEASRRPPLDRKVVPPVTRDRLPLDETTLAETLRAAGYATAHVGKWHLGPATNYPQTQGFDANIGGTMWGAPQTFWFPFSGSQHFGGEPRYVPHLEDGQDGDYLTDALTGKALAWLDRQRSGPFYLNLWYHTVHTPIEGKPAVADKYGARIRSGLNHDNAHYAAMVESLDENVGRVLEKLDALGLRENTVVIFTSDNGGFVNQWQGERVTNNAPLRSGKGSLYEGGIRVPLMVRRPGVARAGARIDEPVSSIDLYPTILALTGVRDTAGHRSDGVSLAGLLRDPSARLAREALFFHYPHYYSTTSPVSALRVGDWKLLEYYEDGKVELYNLAEDPGESRDRSRAEAERAGALRTRLQAWLKSVDAQTPAAP